MSEQFILEHCSPTLAGLKTGNIFSCAYQSREKLTMELRELNHKLRKKGLRAIPLRYTQRKVLIYLYRPSSLRKDLREPGRERILRACGYRCDGEYDCISTLIRRLKEQEDFPHEIGLFLSYPPEDVDGFMRYGGSACKYTGTWKVYGDVERSRATFEKYRHCTQVYCRLGKDGRALEDLAVALRRQE